MRTTGIVAAVGGTVIALCSPAGAGTTAPAPTLTFSSSVDGQQLSKPLVDGSWSAQGGGWSATVRSASLPLGKTQVTAAWTTPVVTPKPHQIWFASAIATDHQGQADSASGYLERVRVCYPHGGCERWLSSGADALPQHFEPGSLPFTITFGHGVSLGWLSRPRPAYVQWQFVQTETGLDAQTDTVRVAVGGQAAAVQSS